METLPEELRAGDGSGYPTREPRNGVTARSARPRRGFALETGRFSGALQ
jgi:hypothetical protein